MKRILPLIGLFAALLMSVPVFSQVVPPPSTIFRIPYAQRPTSPATGTVRTFTDSDGTGCNGDGAQDYSCEFNGSIWKAFAGGTTGGISATQTPTPSAVPQALGTGKLALGWIEGVLVIEINAAPDPGSCTGLTILRDVTNNKTYMCEGSGETPIDMGTEISGITPLANGGTGAALADPGADRIMFWDDSAGAVDWLIVGSGLTITDKTLTASGGGTAPVIRPYSSIPVTAGMVYSKVYNSEEELMHVTTATLLTSNAIWRLRFQMPQALPSGTAKVRVIARANAATGVVKFDPKWCSAAVGEASCTVQSESTQTMTWDTGNEHDRLEAKIALDADTVVAAEIIEMDFTFVDTDTTLAVESGWLVSIIWE